MVLLSKLSHTDLFKTVKLGVDEELYVDEVLSDYSLVDVGCLILKSGYGKLVKVKFPISLLDDFNSFNVGDKISVEGVLRLNTTDLLYVQVNTVLNHEPLGSGFVSDTTVDDVDNIDEVLREDPRVADWRFKVLNRDKVCQCCGGHKHLEAHHIFSWRDYPDLRLDVDNGVALCKWCHHKYNSYYGHKGTGIGMVKFLRQFGVR